MNIRPTFYLPSLIDVCYAKYIAVQDFCQCRRILVYKNIEYNIHVEEYIDSTAVEYLLRVFILKL